MAVITISRQYGTGGMELTRQLSQDLGYHYYAKEIAVTIAQQLGVDAQVIQEYENYLAHTSNWMFSAYAGHFTFYRTQQHIDTAEYLQAVTEIMQKMAAEDHVIILGSGGQCVLSQQPRAFHFRIVASLNTRLRHIRAHYRNPEEIPPNKMLEYRLNYMDRLRRKFIQTHFKMDIDDPQLYHAILNLSQLGIGKIRNLIRQIVTTADTAPIGN
ncbi:cytidylate kinase-like family protein [candidate division KSB1 bacterium]|nr:cytidylate kinase-like family protein [candidate division KSB1 bacterium]